MDSWVQSHFRDNRISNNQLKCIFKPAQVPSLSQECPKYDCMRLLDVYKSRHSGPQV